MGMFDWLFPDPAKKGHKYLDKIPDTIKPYYDPYIQAGTGALGTAQEEYNKLLQDPGAMLNQMGQGYQQSPGFQFALQQALQGSGHAQAAGGMAGSPQHEQQNMDIATQLANQDYNRYLQNVLGLYGAGLGGVGGLTQLGYGASNELANSLGQNLMNKAGLSYAGQANQNQMTGGLLGNFLGSNFNPWDTNNQGGASGGLAGVGQNLAQQGSNAGAMFI